jgi:hypothetical protein
VARMGWRQQLTERPHRILVGWRTSSTKVRTLERRSSSGQHGYCRSEAVGWRQSSNGLVGRRDDEGTQARWVTLRTGPLCDSLVIQTRTANDGLVLPRFCRHLIVTGRGRSQERVPVERSDEDRSRLTTSSRCLALASTSRTPSPRGCRSAKGKSDPGRRWPSSDRVQSNSGSSTSPRTAPHSTFGSYLGTSGIWGQQLSAS